MSATPPERLLPGLAETVAIAVAGGAIGNWVGIPAGWLSGSMIAVGTAAVYGRPMVVPMRYSRAAFVLMGMSIGTVVTPETLQGITRWPLSMVLLVIGTLVSIMATSTYLRRVHGWDRLSALFGSSPGALAQVMAMTAEARADLRAVAIVQSIRVVILSLGLPIGMALLGIAGSRPPYTAVQPDNLLFELAVMVASSVVCAVVLVWLRFPGGWIFGAMLPSAVLHGAGILHVTLPWWGIVVMMISMGAIIGSRFANTERDVLVRYLIAAFGSFAVGITVTLAFVVASVWLLSFSAADVVIAFAPGGQDTMMMLALALGLDPVFVGAHHLARFMLISLCLPLFVGLVRKKTPPPDLPDGG